MFESLAARAKSLLFQPLAAMSSTIRSTLYEGFGLNVTTMGTTLRAASL